MSSINHFTIIGNITKNPELKHLANGVATTTYTVAVNDVWFDKDGKKQENCDFIPITTYGKKAECDVKFLKQGSSVCVIGKIRSWYNQEEKKGGFNFNPIQVKYLGKPSKNNNNDETSGNSEDYSSGDDWTRAYEAEDQANYLGQPRRE